VSILLAAFGAMGSSVDVTPNAVNWANITGSTSGSNANQTIDGISSSISVGASLTGSGILSYSLNGAGFTAYSTPVSVSNGQTLRWTVDAVFATNGTVTVTNQSDGAITLDTFTYDLTG